MRSNRPVATIHLAAIQHNLDLVRELAPGCKTYAMVKADAYGHGSVTVAKHITSDGFAVARAYEAVELREAGIDKPILVSNGYMNAEELELFVRYDLLPAVNNQHQLDLLPEGLPAWIKLNTGMNRLGFRPEELRQQLATIETKNVVGYMAHFANAEVDHPLNQQQISEFQTFFAGLSKQPLVSLSNSAGIIRIPEAHGQWVRPGIMLYGSAPDGVIDPRLQAGMTLSAPILRVNQLKKGDAIGYGSTWTAEYPCRVVVVGLGYADGYPREMPPGTPVLIGGKRRQLVGRISMDTCFALLDEDDDVSIGDPVIFWGDTLPIDEIAECGNTIGYTLMASLTRRVQKIYEG